MLAASITSINGASKIFSIGLITYSNQAKIDILKVHLTQITEWTFKIKIKIQIQTPSESKSCLN